MKRKLVPLALAIALVAAAPALAASTEISVTGNASVSMMPDEATVNAQVQTTADSSTSAIDENNRRYSAIVDALVRAGIKRNDVTLSYYNVNYVPKPNPMPPNPNPYERYGYTVTRSFAVKVRQMNRAGAVVDAATAAGATNIDGVTFGLANSQGARSEATRNAVADARTKATAVAQAAGLHITGIKSISLEGAGAIVRPFVMARMAVPAPTAAPTEFDAGNVNVTVTVSVVYSAAP